MPIRINLNLSNPKTYLALMLFFGGIFIFFGTMAGISSLITAGWDMTMASAGLWVFDTILRQSKGRGRRR